MRQTPKDEWMVGIMLGLLIDILIVLVAIL